MSQAVSAPIIGASVNAPDKIDKNIGRRALLTGLAVAPAALLALSPAPASASGWEDPMLVSKRIDSLFWAARDTWLSIKAEWRSADAAAYLTDAQNDAYCTRLGVAEYSMMTCRILTLPALYAKMDAIRQEPDVPLRGDGDPTTMFDALMWDVERLMMKEYRA